MTKNNHLAIVIPFSLVVLMAGFLTRGPEKETLLASKDLSEEVRGIFAARCAACHGADLSKPEGRFGYVLDLKRLSENPELVIPFHPDESELWVLVAREEMPPASSLIRPLTPEEKESLRTWIAQGAPSRGRFPRP